MTAWYVQNPQLLADERESLAQGHPTLSLDIVPSGTALNAKCQSRVSSAITRGVFCLRVPDSDRSVDYGISIQHPDDYPNRPPLLLCDDPKLPIGNIDRHILDKGQACLAVPSELAVRWKVAPRIVPFLDEVVAPFLAWQVYFDVFGHAPPWGARSHGAQGILEYYAEALNMPVDEHTQAFVHLLARKNNPKGHEMCPCGSGRHLRDCHRDHILNARQCRSWQHAQADWRRLEDERLKHKTI